MRITSKGKSVLAAGIIVASVATAAVVAAPGVQDKTPDWTIAPCSFDFRPGMTRTIELPPFTMTDRCVQPDGSITVADTFKVVEVFPAN